MDAQVIAAKRDALQRHIGRIRQRTPADVPRVPGDPDAQDILSRNLGRAVQICVDLAAMRLADLPEPPPPSMRESFLQLGRNGTLPTDLATRLAKAVVLRNILVHEYTRVDWALVFEAAHTSLPDMEAYARIMPGWAGCFAAGTAPISRPTS